MPDEMYHRMLMLLLTVLNSFPMSQTKSRFILFMDDDIDTYLGRDLFSDLSQRRLQFYDVTGETPETFLILFQNIDPHIRTPVRRGRPRRLNRRNMLLITLIWLKCYPNYNILSIMFDILPRQVSRIVNLVWPILYEILCDNIKWPTRREWRQKRGKWNKLREAVGCIDGTPHEILRPSTEPQSLYYSGYHNFHCVHTQVVIDNEKNIVHVESGFLGHNNDANTFNMMTPVGDGRTLELPRNCYLLGDCIYPSHHPVVTPFTAAQLRGLPRHERRVQKKLNKTIRKYRVYIEHVIRLLKIFKIIGSLYRHDRNNIGKIACLCAYLCARRARLLFDN